MRTHSPTQTRACSVPQGPARLLRTLAAIALAAASLGMAGLRAQERPEGPNEATPFEDLVRAAYAESPELRAAYARWQASLQRVPQAKSLPDPTLGYGYFLERMNARQQFRVEQMLPGFGKRAARASVAQAEADAAAEALEATAADIRLQALQAAANHLLATRALDLVEENLRLVESLSEIASQRYRAGDASQADLLRLENEADMLRLERQSWLERETPLRARVNALLGRPAETPLPKLDTLPALPEPPDGAANPDAASLESNPDLQEAQAQIRQAEEARESARRDGRPDWMVGMEVMDNREHAPDEVMGMISVSIPLWQGRYRAARREAEAQLSSAQASYQARLREIESASSLALYEWRDAYRRLQLFQDTLLPRARQTLAVVESGYRSGAEAFLDLLQAQRTLLDLELNTLRARTDVFARSVEWERLTAATAPAAAELAPRSDQR